MMTKMSALKLVAQTILPHPSSLNRNERRIGSRTMAEIWCNNTAATYTVNESPIHTNVNPCYYTAEEDKEIFNAPLLMWKEQQ